MNVRSVIGIREPGALKLVQTLLRQDVTVRIRVSGESMQPLLKGGEIIEVAPLLGNRLQLGDVLFLCDRQGNPLVHRLIWRRLQDGRLHLLTKGDACAGFDGFSPADNVLGRVRRIIHEAGPPIRLNTPIQRLWASLIVSWTFIFYALRKCRRISLQFVKKNNTLEE